MAADQLDRLEHIVREQSVPLIRTLTFVVLDRQLAADIAQETFLKLYVNWDKVATHPDLPAWIFRVALNRARDHRRSLARASRLVERMAGDVAVSGGAARWEPDIGLIDALRTLPKRQRIAAALFFVGDLPLAEVAQIMGISEGAVSSHLHRARAALRNLLEEG
jgi:RNA polymerase sigma-70 factor, ECF subfamily